MRAGLFTAALFIVLTYASLCSALEVPPLKGRVNDYASMLPPERARNLEERLRIFEEQTGHQIAVLTIPSLEGDSLEGFSIRVAETWKIGQKGFDNGAILLLVRDNRKLRIEVGYGLEGVLPDAIANRIIQEIIVPRFRAKDYPGGIEAGMEAIIKVTRGEVLPEAARRHRPEQNRFWFELVLTLFFLAFGLLAMLIQLVTGRSRNAWNGRGRQASSSWGGPFYGGGFGSGGFGGGGGGFSGGGGGFGGGGASGSW